MRDFRQRKEERNVVHLWLEIFQRGREKIRKRFHLREKLHKRSLEKRMQYCLLIIVPFKEILSFLPLKAYCFKYGSFRESKEKGKEKERKGEREKKRRGGRRFLAMYPQLTILPRWFRIWNTCLDSRQKTGSWNDGNFYHCERITLGIKHTWALDLR